MHQYPIQWWAAPGGIRVSCADIPHMSVVGETRDLALAFAVSALKSALTLYVRQRRKIPPASVVVAPAQVLHLPVVTVAKILLWNTLCEEGLSCADLARRLGCTRAESIRLVNFFHLSKICTLEHALESLGRRLVLVVERDAMPSAR